MFPLTIQFPDGTTAEAADRAELKSLAREWKEANPDSEERPAIVFPIDVTLEDGSTVTVNSKEELKALRGLIEGMEGWIVSSHFFTLHPSPYG